MMKEFDGHNFKNHGIITSFKVELGGNSISIEFKVVNVATDYNFLLGWNWS
jgi:hypothetical protein